MENNSLGFSYYMKYCGGYVPSKRFRKYHSLARGWKFFDAERTPLRLHSERTERSRQSSVALHTCRNKKDSRVIVFMNRPDQNRNPGRSYSSDGRVCRR